MKLAIALLISIFFSGQLFAQSVSKKDSLAVQLYAEAYATIVDSKPPAERRSGFIYNYPRANSAGINIALARLYYQKSHFRTVVGVMAGDYPKLNLAVEPKSIRNLYEASVGYRFTRSEEVWLDAGVFPSHIGLETVIGKDNIIATRSITADNSPYFETGFRLSYRPNNHWYFAMLALNGWQTISEPADQFGASWGAQVTYTPTAKLLINNSSFIGKVFNGTKYITRIYSNLYSVLNLHPKSILILGWDFGLQDDPVAANKIIHWNMLQGAFQYKIKPGAWSATARFEQVLDPQNILYQPRASGSTFRLSHASVNLDWTPIKQFMIRAEINLQKSASPVFVSNGNPGKKQLAGFLILSYQFLYSR